MNKLSRFYTDEDLKNLGFTDKLCVYFLTLVPTAGVLMWLGAWLWQ